MAEPTPVKPSSRYRTGVLLLLTLVYGFNFIDRQIVGILAPWIQADLDLTNTQMGLLIGLAFAVFYTVMSVPIAFLADRVNRFTGRRTWHMEWLYGPHRLCTEFPAYRLGAYWCWCW